MIQIEYSETVCWRLLIFTHYRISLVNFPHEQISIFSLPGNFFCFYLTCTCARLYNTVCNNKKILHPATNLPVGFMKDFQSKISKSSTKETFNDSPQYLVDYCICHFFTLTLDQYHHNPTTMLSMTNDVLGEIS